MPGKRLPEWLRKKDPIRREMMTTRNLLKGLNLNTVCENARCPNIGECYSRDTATFMILGRNCTRSCRFCAVSSQEPEPVDPAEPNHLAQAVIRLDLEHVVITSVTRDDLPLGGAKQFVRVIQAVRAAKPEVTLEILTPDFKLREEAVNMIAEAEPEIFNHNIETVPALYEKVRPEADYHRSLKLLKMIGEKTENTVIKSGLMLGLGENRDELRKVWDDLVEFGCQVLTMGQYLQPTSANLPVDEYIKPEKFDELKEEAISYGFKKVIAGPYVRSSYLAEETTPHLLSGGGEA